jgi:2'-5' RNA ligase
LSSRHAIVEEGSIFKLFVAVDLPPEVDRQLLETQPAWEPGLRLVNAEELHLTLHFIGPAEVEAIAPALTTIEARGFELNIRGVGVFRSSRGPTILWAGVEDNPWLQQLHGLLGSALQALGVRLDPRPYAPHITLARGHPSVPPKLIERFLHRHQTLWIPRIPVSRFILYSSQRRGTTTIYVPERTVELHPSGPLETGSRPSSP